VFIGDNGNHAVRKLSVPSLTVTITAPVCSVGGALWRHLVVTYNGSTLTLFVDGLLQASTSNLVLQTASNNSAALNIGSSLGSAAQFSGALSDLRIFSRALSPSEVVEISQPPLPSYPGASLSPSIAKAGTTNYTWSCSAGFFGPLQRVLSRDPLTGVWSSTGDGIKCTSCSAGFFSEAAGQTACSPCRENSFSAEVAASSATTCATCSSGTHSAPGSAACVPPPFLNTVGGAAVAAVSAILVAVSIFTTYYCLNARAKRLKLLRKLAASASFADRTQLLLLRSTPNAPSFTIDFNKGSVRTVDELRSAIAAPLAAKPLPGVPDEPAAAKRSMFVSNPLITTSANLSTQTSTSISKAASSRSLSLPPALSVAAAAFAPTAEAAPMAASAAMSAPSTERVVEVKWNDLVPDSSFKPMFGGFGIVFVANWTSKRKLVAVKVLKSAMLSQEQGLEAVQMLLKEAQGLMHAADGGANEHVVQVFGVAQGLAEGWKTAQRIARTVEARSKSVAVHAATGATATTNSANGSTGNPSSDSNAAAAAAEAAAAEAAAETAVDNNAAARELDALMPAPYLFGLVMSFESGGSLQDSLFPRRAGRLPWPLKLLDKLRIAKEAATGLYGLHRQQIVHGDLKPENVMLTAAPTSTGEPHARLADFGLATIKSAAARASVMSAIQHTDDRRGTWPYMAPEMYRSKLLPATSASRTTDCYAFGTLLHELLAGASPWSGFSEMDRLAALLNGENLDVGLLPKDAPTSVVGLIGRCLSLDRSQRPRMIEVLAVLEQAYENVLSGRFVRVACASISARRRVARANMRHSPHYSNTRACACARARAHTQFPIMQTLLTAVFHRYAAFTPAPYPQDVFLSYAWGAKSARKPMADELYRSLRVAGLRVWMDELEMGHNLAASMSEGISKSNVFVMLVSPDYAMSEPCMFEARSAVAADKPLITVCVEPGFWRTWGLSAGGSGVRTLPDDHELVALARLSTHLFVDLGQASAVNWASEFLSPSERAKLTLPEALPRLLDLLSAARKAAAGSGVGSGSPSINSAESTATASARATTTTRATTSTRTTTQNTNHNN